MPWDSYERLPHLVFKMWRQLRAIATSSRQQEGEMSHDIVLKLQSLDFKCVYRRQHENSLNVNKDSWTTSILAMESQLAWAGKLITKATNTI